MVIKEQTNRQIFYTERASVSVLTAVKELSDYLEKRRLKNYSKRKFVIGKACGLPQENDLAKIKNADGFLIKTYGDSICICGKTDEGTLFGTYYFIERYLGVEWLNDSCEYFESPAQSSDYIEEIYDFSAYMRFLHSHLGFNEKYRARQRLNYTVGDVNDRPSYGGLRGIKFAFSWGLFGHTFEVLLPYEKYYEAHPEWYSFDSRHFGENHRYQICLTNPEVLKIVTENVLAYLKANPDCKIISVSQNDAYADFSNNACMCENCRKIYERDGNYSAVLIEFVNKVARKVKEQFPNVFVHTFAYHNTEEPPKTVIPEDNVIVQFCLHLPFGYSITENNGVALRERRKFENWKRIAKHVFVWTYICDHSWYFAPIGNFRSLYENTVYFLKNGVLGLFQQENYDYTVGEFSDLRGYLTAKLLNYPNSTYEEYLGYIQTYLVGVFGAGGKYIGEYLKLLDEKFYHLDYYGLSPQEKLRFFGDEQFVARGKELYQKALSETSDEKLKERILNNRLQLDFCDLCCMYLAKNECAENSQTYRAAHRAFYEKQKNSGVTYYKENNILPDLSRIDFDKSPFELSQKDKTLYLKEGEWTKEYESGDITNEADRKFKFTFSLFVKGRDLSIRINVSDSEIYFNNNNLTDWAQDCIEVYISEVFNRTSKKQAGDYAYRVNADGKHYAFGHDEKLSCVNVTKSNNGYYAELTIKLDRPICETEKIGFEIMAHDFGRNGEYLATRYWNALKFSAVCDRPDFYGIVALNGGRIQEKEM